MNKSPVFLTREQLIAVLRDVRESCAFSMGEWTIGEEVVRNVRAVLALEPRRVEQPTEEREIIADIPNCGKCISLIVQCERFKTALANMTVCWQLAWDETAAEQSKVRLQRELILRLWQYFREPNDSTGQLTYTRLKQQVEEATK